MIEFMKEATEGAIALYWLLVALLLGGFSFYAVITAVTAFAAGDVATTVLLFLTALAMMLLAGSAYVLHTIKVVEIIELRGGIRRDSAD